MNRFQTVTARGLRGPARLLAATLLCAAAGVAQAQIAATPYGTTLQDFGQAASVPSGTQTLPAGIGTVNTAAVGAAWLTTSPSAAAPPANWPAVGGDHTSEGQSPRNGRFLLLDTRGNQINQIIYSNTLTGLTVGEQYEISFWVTDVHTSNPAQLRFLLDDGTATVSTPVTMTSVANTAAANLPWIRYARTFTATATNYTIRLQETRNNTAGGNDFGLDDIALTHLSSTAQPVPADAPWALGALAAAILGVAVRRRRAFKR